ncbi:MAG: hypothetical protein HGA44_18435 [Cellulomonadaceae bacterium]|nr:hypothetical protein [Cellulomonadaceae bacterium]
MTRPRILAEISREAPRSTIQHGDQTHLPNGTGGTQAAALAAQAKADADAAAAAGTVTWAHILEEEVREALAEAGDVELRAELVQVASVATKWIEAIDKRTEPHHDEPTLTPLGHDHNGDMERWRSREHYGHLVIDEDQVVRFVIDRTVPEMVVTPPAGPGVSVDAAAAIEPWRLDAADVAPYCLAHPGTRVALVGRRQTALLVFNELARTLGDDAERRVVTNGYVALVLSNGSRIDIWTDRAPDQTYDAVALTLPTDVQLTEALPALRAATPVATPTGPRPTCFCGGEHLTGMCLGGDDRG